MYRFLNSMGLCLMLLWALMPVAFASSNDNSLFCDDHVYVSVGHSCDIDISIDALLEGPYDISVLQLAIMNNGAPIDQTDVAVYLGQTLTFEITDTSSGNKCWGKITLEDKIAPTINCAPCSDPLNIGPDCTFNCTSLELFTARDRFTGQLGYHTTLLDKLIVSDSQTFIDTYVTDNCDQTVTASYVDRVVQGDCGDPSLLTRTWTINYDNANGAKAVYCNQFYQFEAFDYADATGPIIVEGDGTPQEGLVIMPPKTIRVPECNFGTSPQAIAAYFDNPDTEDEDSDGNGIDPQEDVDCVIENHEGIYMAYPHYYMPGLGSGTGGAFGSSSLSPGLGHYQLHAQPVLNTICNINVFYTDIVLDACATACTGNVKISRTWTIMDWCTGEYHDYVQNIDLVDRIGPDIDVSDVRASVDPWQCLADVYVPQPKHIYDNCDDNPDYTVKLIGQAYEIKGNSATGFVIVGVRQGVYRLLYEASDCCGNLTKVYVELSVYDGTGPVPVTTENIVLDLTYSNFGEGTSKIFAKDVDNGSYDSCGDVEIFIRRNGNCEENDTLWRDFVTFCCADLKDADFALIDVEFKVEDWLGNENRAWSTVRLEDKGSALVCPPDMVLTCDTDYHNLDLTGGVPLSYTACDQIITAIDTLDIKENTEPRTKRAAEGSVPGYIGVAVEAYSPACGFGAVRRQFDQCTQWLVVEPISEIFDPSTIVFPVNMTVDCTASDTGEPTWIDASCALVGLSLKSDTFRIESTVCAQIINEWTVINWCDYDLTTGEGSYSQVQIINVEDKTKPVAVSTSDLCFGVTEDCLSKGIFLSAVGNDDGACASPWLNWEVLVDLNDDWDIEYTYSTRVNPIVDSEPNPFYLSKTSSGEAITIVLPDGMQGSKAQHRVDWHINDGCGNANLVTTYFTIEDKRAPTPYCLNVSSTIMTDGTVELWAIDFNQGSFDNCSGAEDLAYTFTDIPPPPRDDSEYSSNADLQYYNGTFWYYDSETADPESGFGEYKAMNDYGQEVHRWEPGLQSSGKIFESKDVDASGHIDIPIYVWDKCQNVDFCLVNLRITDNGGGVTGGMVAGVVMTEDQQVVENVMTQIEADMPGYPKYQMTDNTGTFLFENNSFSIDYKLSGSSAADYLNGISTLDLIIIQRHILGIQRFESPYKMIAADVNNDQKINGVDLVELRKLILGITEVLPQNDSWKLVDAAQTLSTSNPWIYDESLFVTNLSDNEMQKDFIGVKIGDVNNDVVASSLVTQPEMGSVTTLTFDDRQVLAGEMVTVNVTIPENIYGLQLSLSQKSIDILDLQSNQLNADNWSKSSEQVSLSIGEAHTLDSELVITFVANHDGLISDLLELSSESLNSEAYVGAGLASHTLQLNPKASAGFKVYQNEPNPFADATLIKYQLPYSAEVTLSFFDAQGKLLKAISERGSKGLNEIQVASGDFEPGLIYYLLESGEFSQIKKMIILD